MTYDASSRKDIRLAEKAAARLATTRLDFLRAALTTPQGRAWFYHFLADCQVFAVDPIFEPHRDYFIQGQRNIGMRIFAEIKSNFPDLYILMEQDENARLVAHDAATERSRGQNSGWDVEGRTDADADSEGDTEQ